MRRRRKDWVWFNGEKWLNDLVLNSCSLAARGLWLEILCWMWNDNKETLDGSLTRLQRLIGIFGDEFYLPLAELENAGVCKIERHEDGDITIYAGKWANQVRSRYISPKVKADVLAAGKCKYCGSTEHLEVDHILAFHKGGTHDRRNLQPLCRTCNRRKKTKSVSEFRSVKNV